MTSEPTATVVVVCRDRWSLSLETLPALLARTDPRHPVVVVDTQAPRSVGAAFDRLAAVDRIRVTRWPRFLGGNEARNLGVDGIRTEWIAFVENDNVLSDGWLDALLAVGDRTGAASVYPAYLEPGGAAPLVHGLGADLELGGPDACRTLHELQYHLRRPWPEVAGSLEPVARVQAEPHAILMRREFVHAMGGFDEGLLGWFDHTDVALHHLRLGAESWLAPEVTCLYRQPPPVALADLSTFSLRWGKEWFDRSLRHFCARWSLDPQNDDWAAHDWYRTSVRRSVLTPWSRLNAGLDHALAPFDQAVARWWDHRRMPVASAEPTSV